MACSCGAKKGHYPGCKHYTGPKSGVKSERRKQQESQPKRPVGRPKKEPPRMRTCTWCGGGDDEVQHKCRHCGGTGQVPAK